MRKRQDYWKARDAHKGQARTTTIPSCSDVRMTKSIKNLKKVHGWTEDHCRYLDNFTTTNISHIAPWHHRNQEENTILLVSEDDKQAVSKFGCFLNVNSEQRHFLSVYVDDIKKLAGRNKTLTQCRKYF